MRQHNTSNVRALVAALTVVTFVVISSYLYVGTPSVSNPSQNSGALAGQAAVQNSTTYSESPTNQPSSTLTQSQVKVQTTQEPAVQNFGNNYFEPPSGILIPANTLIWTNFRLNETTKDFVGGSIIFFPFPDATGVNVTVAVYLNGTLNAESTTPLANRNYGINSSFVPTSNSPNSIFALSGLVPTVGMGTQTGSAVSLSGTTITIAISSDKSIWLAGWTQTDMAGGRGPQFGQSTGQLAGTFEAPQIGTSLPESLPQPTTTLTFELQISGAFFP